MPHYPQSAVGLNYITYPIGPAVTTTVNMDPGVTLNTKGVYIELVTSTPFAANRIRIGLAGVSNSAQTWLCDIATGAIGAETILLPNLLCDQTTTGSSIGNAGWHDIPATIPAGTRISARCQCNVASRLLGIYIILMKAGDTPGISSFTTYGANTTGSRGTNVEPGGTINTKGVYSQIIASTTGIIQWLMLQACHFGASDPNGIGWAFDIATGAAGAEVIIIPDVRIQMPAGATGVIIPRSHQFLTYIPSGTRIAVRASSTLATATLRTIDVAFLTATAPVESSSGGITVAHGYIG